MIASPLKFHKTELHGATCLTVDYGLQVPVDVPSRPVAVVVPDKKVIEISNLPLWISHDVAMNTDFRFDMKAVLPRASPPSVPDVSDYFAREGSAG